MTLSTFQKLLSELLAQYNEEAENHRIEKIDLVPVRNAPNFEDRLLRLLYYEIIITTTGK